MPLPEKMRIEDQESVDVLGNKKISAFTLLLLNMKSLMLDFKIFFIFIFIVFII